MKTMKLILSAILMMVAMCAQAQTIQVMKDGKVIKEYTASEVDSVVYKPCVDRNVYSDAACTKVLFDASKVKLKGSVTLGSRWDGAGWLEMPQSYIVMKVPFTLYNQSLDEKIEKYDDSIAGDGTLVEVGKYYYIDIMGAELIIEAQK